MFKMTAEMPTATSKSIESWIWAAACSIRGAKDAPKYKDSILPLIFTKRLCDVFDDEINRIAKEVGSQAKAFKLVARDPDSREQPVWSVIRKLSDNETPDSEKSEGQLAKTHAIDHPILFLLRQDGTAVKGWRDTPFYWPVVRAQSNTPTAIYTV
jgi:hypothetical protein